MLSIGKLGRGQENYYLATVAQGIEDYYTGSGEAAGEWTGVGAARIGLSGEVDADALRQILGGVNPATGEELGGHNGRQNRVPGWDLTFSAPKSVSVLYALGPDGVPADVVEAHRAAVAAGIAYLERHAAGSRRMVEGSVELLQGEGLVVAAFRHRTSRAGDPQLHTHCLVANLVEAIDGRGWGALHSPPMYQHARTAGFVYQAVLRAELTERLGVEWGEIVNGHADIAGVDRRLVELFSKRRHEIEEALEERGEDSARAAQTATLDTRRAKDYEVDPDTLHERWQAEAALLGAIADLSTVLVHRGPVVRPRDLDDVADDMLGSRGLTAEHASFDRRDVMRSWCVGLPAGAAVDLRTLEELVQGVLEDRRVLPVVDGAERLADHQVLRRPDGSITTAVAVERRWSTTEMLAIEQRLLERAERGRHAGVAVVDADVVETACAGGMLSAEQQAMVRTLTTSGNAVDVVVGRAGTGKTYALAAAAQAWRAEGLRPFGLAIAARAAAELEASAGLPSTTIEQFLVDCDQTSGTLNRGCVVVVDEAGMVDTRRLARLLAHAESAGAKVVLIGDHHQLPSVEAGGAFAALVRRLDVAELTENRRQIEEWERAALDQLRVARGGRPELVAVVERYEAAGRLHIGETPREARAAMVADWFESRQRGEQPIMLALRRRDVAELNARARALLVEHGAIDTNPVVIGGLPFAAGDRVVCLHNDRRLGVHNAMFGTVEAFDADSMLMKVDGDTHRLRVPFAYAADGHLTHAYATTVHKAQGATYERALLLGDNRLYRQAGYTGLSRGKHRNDIYLVDDDDRDRDIELEEHGTHDDDLPTDRFVRALGRDGGKSMATVEREELSGQPAATSLRQLWAERDAHAALSVADDELRVRRLDAEIARRAQLAGLAAEIDRPAVLVEVLGEPPVSLAGRQAWRSAAGAIESYRARWDVDVTEVPVGAGPEHLAQLADVETLIDAAVEGTETSVDAVAGLEID